MNDTLDATYKQIISFAAEQIKSLNDGEKLNYIYGTEKLNIIEDSGTATFYEDYELDNKDTVDLYTTVNKIKFEMIHWLKSFRDNFSMLCEERSIDPNYRRLEIDSIITLHVTTPEKKDVAKSIEVSNVYNSIEEFADDLATFIRKSK